MRNSDDPQQDSGRQTAAFSGHAQQGAESEYRPLHDTAWCIVQASSNCRDALQPWIEAPNETKGQQTEAQLFAEFLFFFTHMVTRRIIGYVGDAVMDKLVSYLGGAIPSAAIECYFSSWPIDRKEKLAEAFVDRLNEAEQQYSEIDPAGEIKPALMLLTRHLLDLLGVKEVVETKASELLQIVAGELRGMNMDQLILNLQRLEN
jgi:hypothetical protein